jgi:hypothetical protein
MHIEVKNGGLMAKRISTFLLIAIFGSFFSFANLALAQSSEDFAISAAETWLTLVDDGKYEGSWKAASSYFRNAVTKEQWINSMNAYRKPLGKIMTRKVESRQYTTSLPGAPDGEYVVIQCKTSFTNKKSAIETITPMKDKDGKWRVSGYYIN